jgi:hypothetical protein
MTTALDGFLDELPDPDMIGESAYRVLHEYAHEIADSCNSDGLSDVEILETITEELDNIMSSAHNLKGIAERHLRQERDSRADRTATKGERA